MKTLNEQFGESMFLVTHAWRTELDRRLRETQNALVSQYDAWAAREIRLVARDFSTLPVAARTLVNHLHAASSTEAEAGADRLAA